MKEIIKKIHKPAKYIFVTGWIIILFMLISSTLLYIGAGKVVDYHKSIEISELLLEALRPISVAVCIGSVSAEYLTAKKEES